MFGSTVLEVAVGMVFVFLLVSLVCSGISDRISDLFNWRAKNLEDKVRDLLLGGDQLLLNKLFNNQVIQSISTIAADKLGKGPQSIAKPQSVSGQPVDTSTQTPKRFPMNIPKRTFVLALFDSLVPNSSGQTTLDGLRTSISNMPSSAVKDELLTLVTGADSTIEGARKNVENWFNAAEEEMTRLFKRDMWKISLLIGIIVAVFFNIDTAAVASQLWHDPTLRAAVVAQATEYANKDNPPAGAISQTVEQINNLNLPIGWGTLKPGIPYYGQCLPLWLGCFGPTDWINWTPGPSSSNPPPSFPLFNNMLIKLIGWVITAFAGAQGAPFWFDILKKLTNKESPPA